MFLPMLARLPDPEAVRRPERGSRRLQGEFSVTVLRLYSDVGGRGDGRIGLLCTGFW